MNFGDILREERIKKECQYSSWLKMHMSLQGQFITGSVENAR